MGLTDQITSDAHESAFSYEADSEFRFAWAMFRAADVLRGMGVDPLNPCHAVDRIFQFALAESL
jgi:hypothetical protein